MGQTLEITVIGSQDRQAIDDAAETLRQIIKGNTAPDGQEARDALRRLERLLSKASAA